MGKVVDGALTMIMIRDCRKVVEDGFLKLLTIAKFLGKLIIMVAFIGHQDVMVIIPVALYAAILILYIMIQYQQQEGNSTLLSHKEDGLVLSIFDIVKHLRLIKSFKIRPWVLDQHARRLSE